jgi:hypothetical protein
VYGLHPLMPTKYIVLITIGNERDSTPMRALKYIIIEHEKLYEVRL